MNEFAATIITVLLMSTLVLIFIAFSTLFFVDLKLARIQSQLKTVSKRRLAKMAIIIYCQNNQNDVIETLRAIHQTKLKSLEIIIVDNASDDSTVKNVKEFLKTHSGFKAATLYKRKSSSKTQAISLAIKKLNKSQAVLVINAGSQLHSAAIYKLRSYIAQFQLTRPIAIASLPIIRLNYLSLAECSLKIIKYNLRKLMTALRVTQNPDENDAQLFLVDQYRSSEPPLVNYCSFLTSVYHSSGASYKTPIPLAPILYFFSLLITTYLLLLALLYQVVTPFLLWTAGAYSILLISYISTPLHTIKDKMVLLYSLPLMYPLLYIYYCFKAINSFTLIAIGSVRQKTFERLKSL